MMTEQNAGPTPTTQAPTGRTSLLQRLRDLGILSVAASLVGGYFQYISTYEQKVSELAQSDLKAATDTFVEISNAYAEAQMLQQLIYFDYLDASGDESDGDKAMTTTAAQTVYPDYVKARSTLRQNSNVHARKAELYIDWTSDLKHDPAISSAVDGDPLTEAMLGDYNFNCDVKANFAHYEEDTADSPKSDVCAAPSETRKEIPAGPRTLICASDKNGDIVHSKEARTINWQSAKHHLLVMHYCFERAHGQIETVRVWASGNTVSDKEKSDFLAKDKKDKSQTSLDNQVIRLDAFMGLVMSQLERIRVKYRPSGPFCHVPLVRELIGIFDSRCTPIRTAANSANK
jgi:hypothetical protein